MTQRMAPPPKLGPPRSPTPQQGLNVPNATVRVGDEVKDAIRLGPSELPPAGDARRDELKRRDDALAERLAKIEEALGLDNSAGPQVDLRSIAIDNEIASKYDYLRVSEALPEYHYYWANFSAQHGLDVTAHQVMGYEVVCGDMPEAKNCRDELGRRKIGDVILMRIKLDEKLKLDQLDRQKREMRERGVLGTLEAMGDRYGRRGIRFYPELNDYQSQRIMRRAHAQQIARQQHNDMLRSGTHPGLQPGR